MLIGILNDYHKVDQSKRARIWSEQKLFATKQTSTIPQPLKNTGFLHRMNKPPLSL